MTTTATKVGWRAAAACAVVLTGCWQSYREYAGAPDAPVDAAVDARGDVDVLDADNGATDDADVIHDGDGGAEADVGAGDADVCDGSWLDPTTGYLWGNPESERWLTWDEAISYCNGLTLCELPAGSWALPTIGELRSLIRGCPDTMTGGACGVGDACVDDSCWSTACEGCPYLSGPGAGGCYWGASIEGWCFWYWSSSSQTGDAPYAWTVGFEWGTAYDQAKFLSVHAACIRRGP
jgi:hypothetical protein